MKTLSLEDLKQIKGQAGGGEVESGSSTWEVNGQREYVGPARSRSDD